MEVIGLKTRHSNYEMIQRIGFILWKPPITAICDKTSEEYQNNNESIENDMITAAA